MDAARRQCIRSAPAPFLAAEGSILKMAEALRAARSPAMKLHETVRPGASFSSSEWARLAGFYGFIAVLHITGWGLYLHYAAYYPPLVGLGFVAYMFGLRHAFDADHIAAVDDTVRFMLQKGKNPLGVGFFFSLGHSTIVLGLAIAIAFAASTVKAATARAAEHRRNRSAPRVSGTFLWIIGILNLLVLLDILKVWQKAKSGTHSHAHLEALLVQRGLINRLFGGRLQKLMNHSWQMYPLGLLFGLGFDTASEVGLLAMTAGASAGQPADAGGAVAADPVCGRHVDDGHHRWRIDVEGLQLGLFESAAQDLLQHHDHRTVGRRGAHYRHDRACCRSSSRWAVCAAMSLTSSPGLTLAYWVTSSSALFLLAWALSVALWKFGRHRRALRRAIDVTWTCTSSRRWHVHSHEHAHLFD